MNKLFTLIMCLTLGFTSFGQVIFESDLSSWTAGDPDGWMGSKTNIGSENVIEQTFGAMHGTAMAQLFNASPDHLRLTTQEVTVTPLETYEIKTWLTGITGSMLRTGYYNVTEDAWFYNEYIDVFAVTGGDIAMVSQTVTMPAGCSEAEFILSLHSTDALVGIVIDSVSIAVIDAPDPDEVSIYEIQYATEDPYISPLESNVVTTRGIVTGVFTAGANEGRFFIQDGTGAWNGIYVYDNSVEVALGDSVLVTGTVDEYFTLTELTTVLEVLIISSDNTLPDPVEVTTLDSHMEEYEGVLLHVTNALCTNDDAGFGQFEVNDETGALLIDDDMFAYTSAIGTYYSITGVASFAFDEIKIFPRMIEDIEVTGHSGLVENENIFSIYPNPSEDLITLKVATDASVIIYNLAGAIVFTANSNVNTIDVSSFDAGVYQIVVTQNETVSTQRLMVK